MMNRWPPLVLWPRMLQNVLEPMHLPKWLADFGPSLGLIPVRPLVLGHEAHAWRHRLMSRTFPNLRTQMSRIGRQIASDHAGYDRLGGLAWPVRSGQSWTNPLTTIAIGLALQAADSSRPVHHILNSLSKPSAVCCSTKTVFPLVL